MSQGPPLWRDEGDEHLNHLVCLDEVDMEYPHPITGEPQVVLDNFNLRVRPGELVTIVGPSGCGKSTLLRLILGAERPTRGTVRVNGMEVVGPDQTRGIVYQKYSLFPHRTVMGNVNYGPQLREFSLIGQYWPFGEHRRMRNLFRSTSFRYLERVGLAEHADKYPHQLSGGMRQRAAIAQTLIMKPQVLLMDEPFGALDLGTRQDMQLFLLEEWQNDDTTIFFVTHDTEEALFLGTRLIVLSQFYEDALGAKIVKDIRVPWAHPKPDNFKYSDEFTQLLREIRQEGLDQSYLQRRQEFDLQHEDAV